MERRKEEEKGEAQIHKIADKGTATEIVCNQDEGQDDRTALRADQPCEQHGAAADDAQSALPQRGVRLCAHQQVEHEHTEGQGEKDVVGKGQTLTGGQQIVKLVSERHDRRPAEETEVIAQAAAGVQEALHNQIGKPHAHTAGGRVEQRAQFGREQAGDMVQMVQHHEQRHKELEFKCIPFS